MRCAFGAHLDVSLAERRTPCRLVGNLTFPSLFVREDGCFDKTESLVMMPLCSAFTAADKTDSLAAGSITEMSFQWVGINVVLCCCHMNMPSAGRTKFADCNVHEDKKVISKQLSKLCVPKLR